MASFRFVEQVPEISRVAPHCRIALRRLVEPLKEEAVLAWTARLSPSLSPRIESVWRPTDWFEPSIGHSGESAKVSVLVKPSRVVRVVENEWFPRQEGKRKSRGSLPGSSFLSRRSRRATGDSPWPRHWEPIMVREASSVDIGAFLRGASWSSHVLRVKNPWPDTGSAVEW
jgi:hypothetical protein